MPDKKPESEDGQESRRSSEVHVPEPQTGGTHTTTHSSQPQAPNPAIERDETKKRESVVDGRLDPDAQSPDNERAKPFDPKENDPA
ncbi:hypothetical protein OPKNFCMD_6703 [Methylobacterium crusticola]|uniref:MARCKS-like protein n=1 Tax=Methylobacterium crusticola TaxID=1697972 RepID=A0ABQ4R9K6_9HYPH|nr:hypothetical protein [Methylobacterium crusticola]GJD53924.1 hypothetical protein OPKNFCMD_6703 [Methylobacterium crusticola]